MSTVIRLHNKLQECSTNYNKEKDAVKSSKRQNVRHIHAMTMMIMMMMMMMAWEHGNCLCCPQCTATMWYILFSVLLCKFRNTTKLNENATQHRWGNVESPNLKTREVTWPKDRERFLLQSSNQPRMTSIFDLLHPRCCDTMGIYHNMCLQKEMATLICVLVASPDDVPHCQILPPDKTERPLISATLCGWRRCFVADQLWFMTHIQEEEDHNMCLPGLVKLCPIVLETSL